MILTPNRCPVVFAFPSDAHSFARTRDSIDAASAARSSAASATGAPIAPVPTAPEPVVAAPYPAVAPRGGETALNSELVSRVLAEYREMPGLLLTLPQACRLWNTDPATVRVVFELLVVRGSLRQSGARYLLADFERRCAS